MLLDPTAEIECPHCAEFFTIFLDLSQGNTEYIEDCQVCCKPMMIKVLIEDIEAEEFTVTIEPGMVLLFGECKSGFVVHNPRKNTQCFFSETYCFRKPMN